MKISPAASTQNVVTTAPETPAQGRDIRSIRMATNATPLRMAPPAAAPEAGAPAPASDPKLGISDPSDPAARPEATEPLSPQLAALARQRRALQVKERELTAREEAMKTQTPAQGAGIDMARLKAEPLSVLQEAGITYDQLSQALLAQMQGVSPEQYRALQAEVQALKEGFDKKLTDRDAQTEQQALQAMTTEAHSIVSAAGEEFELVRETKSVPDAIRLIKRIYDEKGEVKDVRWALAEIESELVKDVLKVAGLKKVQGQLQPQAPAPAQQPQQRPAMRTLSNRDTATAPMSAKQRALAAFWGQPTN